MVKTINKKLIAIVAALVVLAVTLSLALVGCSSNKVTPPANPQTENNLVVTPDETSGAVRLAVMPLAANGGINQLSEDSYTVTATILPASALQKANWAIAWKNGSSSWANGKSVADYVTLTVSEENGLTATISCKKAFSEQKNGTIS